MANKKVMWALTALFGLRVAAQALQYWAPQPFLPPFDDFQGSNLQYGTLLASQLVILAAMLYFSQRIRSLKPDPKTGRLLWWIGGIYMAGSILRIIIGVGVPSSPPWFHAWISAIFHLVLAGFLLTLAAFHRQRAA